MAYLTAAAIATTTYAIALLAILLGVREVKLSTSTVTPRDTGERRFLIKLTCIV